MNSVQTSVFGDLLRRWRETRRYSQLDLALEAQVSSRHISFMETGRAKPSREMVLTLAGVLDVPLRERNALLHSAGFAPVYKETPLCAPQMTQVFKALELILRQQEPMAAIVFDRRWDIVMANSAYARISELFFGSRISPIIPMSLIPPPRPNVIQTIFDPEGWRPFIANWETVAKAMLTRLQRATLGNQDSTAAELLKMALGFPQVPARWREPDFSAAQEAILPLEIRFGDRTLKLFSTFTTLGSPQDITLQELSIEAFHPTDEATAAFARQLATVADNS